MAVTVGRMIERLKAPLQLEQLGGTGGHEREIENPDVSSPGLALAGYVGRFTAQRVQILGETEITYLSTLSEADRRRILAQFFAFPIPLAPVKSRPTPNTSASEPWSVLLGANNSSITGLRRR